MNDLSPRLKSTVRFTLSDRLPSGKNTVSIDPPDWLASGGQGHIYMVNNIVYKIFHDPAVIQNTAFSRKIQRQMDRLDHAGIVSAKGFILDKGGKSIGIFMPRASGYTLAEVSESEFWRLNGLDRDIAFKIVTDMYDIVKYAHSKRFCLTDPNQFSWIIDPNDNFKLSIIDVDGWSDESSQGDVIMPTIRDYHRDTLSKITDWFAWSICSFQLLCGQHPYKGSLKGYEGRPSDRMIKRMIDNKSIYTQGAIPTNGFRDINYHVPDELSNWFHKIFQEGERGEPPKHIFGGAGNYALSIVPDRNDASVINAGGESNSIDGQWYQFLNSHDDLRFKKVLGRLAITIDGYVFDLVTERIVSIGGFDQQFDHVFYDETCDAYICAKVIPKSGIFNDIEFSIYDSSVVMAGGNCEYTKVTECESWLTLSGQFYTISNGGLFKHNFYPSQGDQKYMWNSDVLIYFMDINQINQYNGCVATMLPEGLNLYIPCADYDNGGKMIVKCVFVPELKDSKQIINLNATSRFFNAEYYDRDGKLMVLTGMFKYDAFSEYTFEKVEADEVMGNLCWHYGNYSYPLSSDKRYYSKIWMDDNGMNVYDPIHGNRQHYSLGTSEVLSISSLNNKVIGLFKDGQLKMAGEKK